jgi:hypothetical protein
MTNYNLLPTYLEEILSSVKVHLEQINLGINHEQGKIQENLALSNPRSHVHERIIFRKKTAA